MCDDIHYHMPGVGLQHCLDVANEGAFIEAVCWESSHQRLIRSWCFFYGFNKIHTATGGMLNVENMVLLAFECEDTISANLMWSEGVVELCPLKILHNQAQNFIRLKNTLVNVSVHSAFGALYRCFEITLLPSYCTNRHVISQYFN